jgi:diaminohydroxyphosphoribosylaminopyrimidine deaminase/5-amino-6-(5-phosphoribosylamino)uracil reductase
MGSLTADTRWMGAALALGERTRGRTAPNPNVGCVIVRDGRVIGRGATQPGGRPHAEAIALAEAGTAARGATVYTTLEPCAHVSARGPACADLLIAAGVARVVVALGDPDPRTNGSGMERLRAAGVAVTKGVCAAEAIGGVPDPAAARTPVRHAEARDVARRLHRAGGWIEPLDHRPAGAGARASGAQPA